MEHEQESNRVPDLSSVDSELHWLTRNRNLTSGGITTPTSRTIHIAKESRTVNVTESRMVYVSAERRLTTVEGEARALSFV